MIDLLLYECANDDCSKKGVAVGIPRSESADCPKCGWSMTAVPLPGLLP